LFGCCETAAFEGAANPDASGVSGAILASGGVGGLSPLTEGGTGDTPWPASAGSGDED
jgi:hypothetical protein